LQLKYTLPISGVGVLHVTQLKCFWATSGTCLHGRTVEQTASSRTTWRSRYRCGASSARAVSNWIAYTA